MHDPPEDSSPETPARIRFDLHWQSEDAMHTDSRVASGLALCRDLIPPELEAEIMDRPVGHCAILRFEPGAWLAPPRDDLLRDLRPEHFQRRLPAGARIEPRAGRFYPRGILGSVDGISAGDRRPLRLVEVHADRLTADLNHPLAGRALDVAVRIEAIRAREDRHREPCTEVDALLTDNGPGMQARWRGQATDFWSDDPFGRSDPRPDAEFYASPRLVDHLDRTAIAEISGLYGRLIPPGARILDLMTSWHSHLPSALEPAAVTGLGMNMAELEANPILTHRLVHDLNRDPTLPFADADFSAVICTVSVEYLTRPFEVFREVARVLKPGGRFVLTFSDRWFPPKVIRIWQELHAFERLALVLEYLRESGRFGRLETFSLRGHPRPADDKYADRLAESDPVFAVWGTRL
ncbi:methyltransferase domain-containing protein [Thiocapsa bogorovii]|uniref:methyltransferase domain-containing protein n=1 Tax=Thiocapsa bogorovii TaxID=521689 RepID=UPI001E3450B4|nr:methyltransferase domain-containing protein [Thiocapsa bogorovii]UHD16586.1 methyltransferase domain-containing protein [Thiocapsa bogorovii]